MPRTPMDSQGRYLLETTLLLVVMCALAVIVLWIARRAGVGSARGPIQLVGQLPLEARRSVYLIRIAGKVLVIGVAEGGMVKLGELSDAELPAQTPPSPPRFAEVLARVLGTKNVQNANMQNAGDSPAVEAEEQDDGR